MFYVNCIAQNRLFDWLPILNPVVIYTGMKYTKQNICEAKFNAPVSIRYVNDRIVARHTFPILSPYPLCSTTLQQETPDLDCDRSCLLVPPFRRRTCGHWWTGARVVPVMTSVDTFCHWQSNALDRGTYELNVPICTLKRQQLIVLEHELTV